MTTILFAGGGSGGHLFPGVAVAEEFARRNFGFRTIFVGSNRSLEDEILRMHKFEHVALGATPSSAIFRSPIASAVKNWKAYRSGLEVLDRLEPDVVIGLGGFASVPMVVGAWRRKIPILLLEQNAVLGRANRLLLPLSQTVCLSYPNTPLPNRHRTRAKLTGNPVRAELRSPASCTGTKNPSVPTLLIMGGSQGAIAVNVAVLAALPQLQNELKSWRIIHQTGASQERYVRSEYDRLGISAEVSPFLTDMHSVYRESKFVVSRAGATSLAEFAACGLPALLIPYPKSIRDHQKRNAEFFAENGGAILMEQSPRLADELARNLRFLLTDAHRCEMMGKAMLSLAKPEAASEVVDLILSLPRLRMQGGISGLSNHDAVVSTQTGQLFKEI